MFKSCLWSIWIDFDVGNLWLKECQKINAYLIGRGKKLLLNSFFFWNAIFATRQTLETSSFEMVILTTRYYYFLLFFSSHLLISSNDKQKNFKNFNLKKNRFFIFSILKSIVFFIFCFFKGKKNIIRFKFNNSFN
jgi:hypothetical protein